MQVADIVKQIVDVSVNVETTSFFSLCLSALTVGPPAEGAET